MTNVTEGNWYVFQYDGGRVSDERLVCHWPDYVKLLIKPRDALDLARDILGKLSQGYQLEGGKASWLHAEILLIGELTECASPMGNP